MTVGANSENKQAGWDGFGAFASGTCAIHCVICALIPGALAAVGLGALLGHRAEWGLAIIAIIFAGVAAYLGWKNHASYPVVVALLGGAAGLLLARVLEMVGLLAVAPVIGIASSVLLVGGHIANLRESKARG